MKTLLAVLLASSMLYPLSVPLRAFNELTYSRSVPVTMGVPLPQGAFSKNSLDTFALLDNAGNAVPADFQALNLWEDTVSVRWLQVNTQLSMGPRESLYVYLTDKKGRNDLTAVNKLSAVKQGDKITVITGPLKFIVRGTDFNGIDSAWIDESGRGAFDPAHCVVAGNVGGFSILLNTTESMTSLSGAGTATIEELSPFRAVILVKGRYGANVAHFTRIYAYHNKSYVRMVHTFWMDNMDNSAYLSLHRLSFDLKTALSGALRSFVPGDSLDFRLPLTDSVVIHQVDLDRYRIKSGTAQIDTGKGVSRYYPPQYKFIRTGWGAMDNGSLGVAGGLRYFFEMFPKAVELKSSGVLSLCLYKRSVPDAERMFSGEARTNELFLNFYQDTAQVTSLEANGAARAPVFLVAPPRWYCGQTQCLHAGLADSLSANFLPAYQSKIRDYNKALNAYCVQHLRTRRELGLSRGASWRTYCGFGFINFGDEWDEANIGGCTVDNFTFQYDNNYYDFPYAVLMSFFVCGSTFPLTLALENCTHMLDVDHNSWHSDPLMVGACRQCFSVGHVRGYDSPCNVYHSSLYNHWKCESAFELFYLTADRFYLDRGLALADYVVRRNTMGMDCQNNPRSVMSSLNAMTGAFRCTHDKKYLDNTWKLWSGPIHSQIARQGNVGLQDWMQGLAMEGMAKAQKIEPDSARAAYYKADLLIQRAHTFGVEGGATEGLWAAAWAYKLESRWPAAIGSVIGSFPAVNTSALGNIHKYAGANRAIHHFMGMLTATNYNPFQPVNYLTADYVAVERDGRTAGRAPGLRCRPTPFNPVARITFHRDPSATDFSLLIYDARGVLVEDLTPRALPFAGTGELEWNASRLGSGIFFVKIRSNGRASTERVVLVR